MEASGDIRILIVEDELIIAEDIRTKLTGLGYNVTGIAMTADEAEQLLESARPDIVMLDILLKGERDGIDLARIIKDHYKIPFIFLTETLLREPEAFCPTDICLNPLPTRTSLLQLK